MSARLAPIGSVEAATRWRELAVRARIEARNGETMDKALLWHAISRTRRADFPIGGSGPTRCARALVDLATAYVETALPARITTIATMLEAAAIGVDALLDEPAIAAAAESRRRLGEREEV